MAGRPTRRLKKHGRQAQAEILGGKLASVHGPPVSGADDSVARLERLAGLHASGALTDEELAAEKAKIVGGESGGS